MQFFLENFNFIIVLNSVSNDFSYACICNITIAERNELKFADIYVFNVIFGSFGAYFY